MNKVIGIISYLPSNETRAIRVERLNKLMETCSSLFNLPIIIVAQNWDDELAFPNATIYKYPKLGITGARKELRRLFLESNYDYLIMLDDDCDIQGNKEDAEKYLLQIDQHPDMYGIFKHNLLKLFAISKEMFKLIDYGNGEAERGEIFEDMLLIMSLQKLYPQKGFTFNTFNLREVSDSAYDKYSTWYHNQFVKTKIGDNTRRIVKELQ